jgi:hypothetical protein
MIKRVTDDESRTNLVCEYGIPEQTLRGWISFVDSKEDSAELQRKKKTAMYVSAGTSGFSKSTPSAYKGVILKAQGVQFSKLLSRYETFKASDRCL